MKTTKEEILLVSLRLFAERGYDAVSISMIAEEIGITKGALYRHFVSKQEIYDKILEKMTELDAERAREDNVPVETKEAQEDSYENRSFHEFCSFAVNQFDFWTENEFAVAFRKMLMLEQYKSPEKMKQYQEMICEGPVKYSEDLLSAMIKENKLNDEAKALGARNLAMEIYAPLFLMIQLYDGGADRDELHDRLNKIIGAYEKRYKV